MSATTSTPRSSRIRGQRPLARLAAAAAGCAITASAALSMLAGGAADAATKPAWFMTAGNIKSLSQAGSATAAHSLQVLHHASRWLRRAPFWWR